MPANPVIRFPVRPKPREACAVSTIVDMRGVCSSRIVGRAQVTRKRAAAVSLPHLNVYDGEAVYLDGRLIIGGKVVRERKP